jgi:hypothetical protein
MVEQWRVGGPDCWLCMPFPQLTGSRGEGQSSVASIGCIQCNRGHPSWLDHQPAWLVPKPEPLNPSAGRGRLNRTARE